MHITEYETDGVVQLVGHPGNQPAKCRHFLGTDQMLLGVLEILQRIVQFPIGMLQFSDGAPDQHHPDRPVPMIMTRRTINRNRHLFALCIFHQNLAIEKRAVRLKAGQEFCLCIRVSALQNKRKRQSGQLASRKTRQGFQCAVDLLDTAITITDNHQIGHRPHHAGDKFLCVFKFFVFLFQRNL